MNSFTLDKIFTNRNSVDTGRASTSLHYLRNFLRRGSLELSLHLLRFEMDRSQWEVEKAELQARIAFLQGERKGQENLKNDLVR